jgi:hypothetical protein
MAEPIKVPEGSIALMNDDTVELYFDFGNGRVNVITVIHRGRSLHLSCKYGVLNISPISAHQVAVRTFTAQAPVKKEEKNDG